MVRTSDLHANQYETLVDATIDLTQRGYVHNFQINASDAICLETDTHYQSSDISIIEYHRFEGNTGPQDMSILYVIECSDGTKGTIIDAYGTYSNAFISEFMDQVKLL